MAEKAKGKDQKKMKQLTIRIPEDLHTQFKIKCVKEGRAMGEVYLELIRKYVEAL